MKNWQTVLLLLTVVAFCCMVTSYFLYEGYTQEDKNTDKQKMDDAVEIFKELVSSGVLPSKIPLDENNRKKIIEAAGAFVRVVKNDALHFLNQKSDNIERTIEDTLGRTLERYTTSVYSTTNNTSSSQANGGDTRPRRTITTVESIPMESVMQ